MSKFWKFFDKVLGYPTAPELACAVNFVPKSKAAPAELPNNVVKLVNIVNGNIDLDPDLVLDKAKGCTEVLVIAIKDDELYVAGSHGLATSVLLIERAKFDLMQTANSDD